MHRARVLVVAVVAVVVVMVAAVTVLIVDASDPAPTARRDDGPVTASVDPGAAEVGTPLPAFVLPGLAGGRVDLAAAVGHPVVVNFWASWCHPCREEFPLLERAVRRHRAQGLEVIGISYRDIASDARTFARRQGATWSLARDPDGLVARAYGVTAIPQTFFVDAEGVLRSRAYGISSRAALERELASILPDRPTAPGRRDGAG